ncbi:MAG: glycosyltransferase family 9 protein, partial [Bdellovibrionales bacterium]|nr:glycosyltransferase family 9 protein [Bdellovibrionales bacterium]
GTEAERGTINQIKSAAPESIDLCGQTSFVEIGTLARHAAVAIGNDTGPMHMIGIMNCPVVSLFSGVTSPEKSRPAGRYVETLQAQNIADITAGDVLQKTLQMLQSP